MVGFGGFLLFLDFKQSYCSAAISARMELLFFTSL